MRARFRIRFKTPLPDSADPWMIMLNQICEEEAYIADQAWEGLEYEKQEIWRASRVVPDLLEILTKAREQKRWTMNPYLAMHSYRHMIMLLQPPNWGDYFLMIKFGLFDLKPRPANQEISAREDALSALAGPIFKPPQEISWIKSVR
jgi:hypothetical protein